MDSVFTFLLACGCMVAGFGIIGAYILVKKYQDKKFREEQKRKEEQTKR